MTVTTAPTDWTVRAATELHPHWCVATTATDCGTHLSNLDPHRATANPAHIAGDGWAPYMVVSAWMGPNGERGVQVDIAGRRSQAEAVFTAEEWRAIVQAGNEALALIGADPRMGTRPVEGAR